ncbi:hypothetical protein AAC387_Pa07g0617 [Persea americana]
MFSPSFSFLLSKSFQFLLLLLSFLYCNNPTTALTLIAKSCSDTSNYTTNSTFETNLDLLLSSLSSNFPSSGYNNASAGESPDAVYGLFLCRGDVSPDTCRSCVTSAVEDIKDECPNKKNATTWYDVCFLRYSETRFFSVMDNSSKIYKPNAQNVTNPTLFNTVLRAMLTNISSVATNSSWTALLYASGMANYTSTQMVYGLVQCTRDLSVKDCNGCLESAMSDIPVCCNGSQGGRVLGKSCNLRFEVYPFVDENSAASGSVPPFPSTTPTTNITNSSSNSTTDIDGNKRTSARIIIAIVVPVVAGVALSIFIMYAYRRRRRNKKKAIIIDQSKHQIGDIESLQFDLGTIRAATNNFSDANKLGQGGFGAVYKGKFSDGQEIAVKRLFRSSRQEGEEQILIFEYVPNESLEKFLFNPAKRACLSWENRYKIIGGIAKGLLYLHEDSRLKIIHRDLKASNILLDGEMKPKISDFGTARLFEVGQTQGNTSCIAGTYGYMSPEYAMHGKFSIKSDVFSFGVLVLEIVTGLKNSGFYQSTLAEDLPSYAWSHWNEGTVMELIDDTLSERCCMEEVIRCIHIGLLCVQEKVTDRPTMSSVVLMLNKDSVTLPPPLPPVFSDSHRGFESEHHTVEYDSTTGELDLSADKLLCFPVNEESDIESDAL